MTDSIFELVKNHFLAVALIGFVAFRFWSARRVRSQLPALLEAGAVIVDVRSAGEFAGGSAPGSINLSLDRLASGASSLDATKPVIVCCASGTRSAMAAQLLRAKGFGQVLNGGSWTNVMRGQASKR